MRPFQQFDRGRRVFQRADGQVGRLDAVQLQHLAEQLRHAGAFRAEVDLLALQVGQLGDRDRLAHEQPYRFGEQAAQRDQALAPRLGLLGRAALHERDVDLALVQALQVFLRAERALERDLDVVLGEGGGVLLAEFFVGAVFLAGGQQHLARRGRIDQQVGQPRTARRSAMTVGPAVATRSPKENRVNLRMLVITRRIGFMPGTMPTIQQQCKHASHGDAGTSAAWFTAHTSADAGVARDVSRRHRALERRRARNRGLAAARSSASGLAPASPAAAPAARW